MKRVLMVLVLSALALNSGCKNSNNAALEKRVDDMEKKVAQLEKRPAFPGRPTPPAQEKAYNIPVGNSPVLGDKNAKVSVVIFSDRQCPFCSKTDPLLQEVIKDPVLSKQVNVVFKEFPLSFHPNARPAAKAALAAGEQGKFWEMTTKMYANQQTLSAENYTKWAKELGLNVAKFQADLKANDAAYEKAITADTELGTKEANVRGTPSLYVGGWELQERSVDGIKNLLKEKKLLPNS